MFSGWHSYMYVCFVCGRHACVYVLCVAGIHVCMLIVWQVCECIFCV